MKNGKTVFATEAAREKHEGKPVSEKKRSVCPTCEVRPAKAGEKAVCETPAETQQESGK